MRGRKPVPTRIKELAGNPGKRPLNQSEPKPPVGMPAPPRWLDRRAKYLWRRLVKELVPLGVLTQVDFVALEALCQTYSAWRQYEELVRTQGATLELRDAEGKVKYVQQRPEVGIARGHLKALKELCSDFGLTPSSRSRIGLPQGGKQALDPFEAFLKGIDGSAED